MSQDLQTSTRPALGSLPLPDHQREIFAQHYSATGVASRSAAAAGLGARYSHRRLLNDVEVAARIRFLNEQQFREVGISAETIKRELARVAMASGADLFDSEGRMINIAHLPDDVAATITGIDVEVQRTGSGENVEEVVVKKVRRADKMAALALLARHFKIVGAEDDGVNALATALADRLNAAKRRQLGDPLEHVEVVDSTPSPAVEDARIIESIPTQEPDDEQLW